MEIPTDVALASLSLAAAGVAHAGRIIYLTVRDQRGQTPYHELSPSQMQQLAEVVAQAVSARLDHHSAREERTLERLVQIEERAAERMTLIEAAMERLVLVYDMNSQRAAEQHRNIMDRLASLEHLNRRQAA